MLAERSIRDLDLREGFVSFHDSVIVSLVCIWLFLQCFQYQYLSPIFQIRIGITISPDRLVFGMILILYLMRASTEVEGRVRANLLEKLFFCFACVGTISWLIAGSDAQGDNFRWLTTLANLSYVPLLTYFMARRLPCGPWMIRKVMGVFSVIGVYLALTALCEHWGFDRFVIPDYILNPNLGIQYGRARGPFLSSTVDGGILLISFLALMFLSSLKTGIKRWIMFSLSLLVAVAIYFTETRSIWIGLAAILFTLFLVRGQMRKPAGIILCILALAFVAGVGSMFSLYENTLFSKRPETIDYRFANYATTFNMFSRNPLFGIGYGNFNKLWTQYFVGANDIGNLEDGNHSTLLGIFAELGLLGFTLYAGILLCALRTCISAFRHLKQAHAFERDFSILALAALEAFFLIGLTSDLRFHQLLNVAVFFLIGVAAALERVTSHSENLATQAA
jgi:O-antigen ligase